MSRPTLEYTYIKPFSATPATLTMEGPSGMKPLVTLLVSYTGGDPGGLSSVTFDGIGDCTRLSTFNLHPNYVDMWRRYNTPIVSGSTTLTLSGGGTAPYGGVEVAYWDASAVANELAAATGTGTSGGFPTSSGGIGSGYTSDESIYGMMMGTTVSAWHLAGGPLMEAIYPSYATIPPGFTNSAAVSIGAPTQAGAPMVCSGFIRTPSATDPNYFAFTFGASTNFNMRMLKVTGPATPAAVASQMVTILG